MRVQNNIDRSVAALAARQHGVAARRQLLALGLKPKALAYRVRTGRLIPLFRGIYALGHAELRPQGRAMAAVLACGADAALSHRSAAALWGLRGAGARRHDVVIPTASHRAPDAARIAVHRYADLRPGEVTAHDGIPVTTPARTLFDLAAILRTHQLRRAVEQAEILELFDLHAVTAVLDAHRGRPGAPALAALLEDLREHGVTFTRSDVEAAFLQICIDLGLPRPLVNRHVDGRELDFRWPDIGLVVEVNSYRYHRSRAAFERDHAKRLALEAAGYRVISVTDWQVMRERSTLAQRMASWAPSWSPKRQ